MSAAAPVPDPADVRRMFDRIAPAYDVMNSVMTAGLDGRWRAAAIRALRLRPGDRVLDVAAGTGKLALAAAAAVGPEGEVIGLDASPAMLAGARRAAARLRRPERRASVRWMEADAMSLPFVDGSFDGVSIGFGLRNLPDAQAGLREMARVLRPGGWLAVLEIAAPGSRPARLLFETWFRRVIPRVGRVIGLADEYAYLPASLDRYPPPQEVADMMRAGGLVDVRWRSLPSGLATLHSGRRGDGA